MALALMVRKARPVQLIKRNLGVILSCFSPICPGSSHSTKRNSYFINNPLSCQLDGVILDSFLFPVCLSSGSSANPVTL